MKYISFLFIFAVGMITISCSSGFQNVEPAVNSSLLLEAEQSFNTTESSKENSHIVKSTSTKIVTGSRIDSEGDSVFVEVNFPQFENLDIHNILHFEKTTRINSLIKNEVLKVLTNEPDYDQNKFSYFLYYDIELVNDNIISVFNKSRFGWRGLNQGLYNHAFGVTVDLVNEKTVQLSDIITDFDKLFNLLKNDKFEAILTFHDGDGICRNLFSKNDIINYHTPEKIISILKADNSYMKWNKKIHIQQMNILNGILLMKV